ncbi:MAG: YiiD C-terminal domain-containing protein [Gammaproteobacteria bacterium]|nr:YiiD C-terminal domain-containing protein [Gammaproteobacteria bacterium]
MTPLQRIFEQSIEQIDHLSNLKIRPINDLPDRSEFELPLPGNQNHKGSMFGGSIAMSITAAGWMHTARYCTQHDSLPTLVVRHQHIDFIAPQTTNARLTVVTVERFLNDRQQEVFKLSASCEDQHGAVCARANLEFRLLDLR